jgi:hypothetical protein
MKASAVYRKAAEIADSERVVGCYAIDLASGEGYGIGPAYDSFEDYFKPENAYELGWGWFGDCMNPTLQNSRVLALLLMAEIARDEE